MSGGKGHCDLRLSDPYRPVALCHRGASAALFAPSGNVGLRVKGEVGYERIDFSGDEGALALSGFKQTLADQPFDGFSKSALRDLIFLDQLGVGRQLTLAKQITRLDLLSQVIDNPLVLRLLLSHFTSVCAGAILPHTLE